MHIILLCLPYAIASGAEGVEQKAAELLEKTDVVASAPPGLAPLVEAYFGDDDLKPFGYESALTMLQKQLQSEAASGWKLACVPRMSRYIKAEGETNGNGHVETTKHAFPVIDVPSTVNPGPNSLFPAAYFSVYADQDIEVCFENMPE